MSWNLADVIEAVAGVVPPDHTALIHGEGRYSWRELQQRSNNLARALRERGLRTGDRVAFYLRNHPAYLETALATFKSRLTHVNVNYRFQAAELRQILEDSGSRAVLYGADLLPVIEVIRAHVSQVVLWVQVDGETAPFAESFESLACSGRGSPLGLDRSPEDLLFIYTGGTTGRPKGVMWTHGALLDAQFRNLGQLESSPPPRTIDEVLGRVRRVGMANRQLPAAPMVHATALVVAIGALVGGGSVVILPNDGSGFDPEAVWRSVEAHGVTSLTIVGDAFAKPLLKALEREPGRYRLDSLRTIVSSGVIWSTPVKQALLRLLPHVTLLDTLSSTEAPACGTALMTSNSASSATFRIGPECKVFSEDGLEIRPGSGEIGLVARSGPLPLGYHNDPAKTAETFRMIDGVRYAIPGDYCMVEADGSLVLLGRGSQCINSGGEKVFVEEVEEALKSLPGVDDALVIGLPDPAFGQVVAAAVAVADEHATDAVSLRQALQGRLAGYKIPRVIVLRSRLPRLPNGKADYRTLRSQFD